MAVTPFQLLIVVLGLALTGCRERGAVVRPDGVPADQAPSIEAERLPRTTDGANAEGALDGEIEALAAQHARRPDWLRAGPTLIARLGQRAGARSSMADRTRALALADAWVADRPKEPRARLARAGARAALHLYAGALEDLESSWSGPDAAVTRAGVLLALGRWDRLEGLVGTSTDPARMVVCAGWRAEQGRIDEADALFRRAASGLRTTSPHGLASVLFQHGVVLEQAGRPAEARARYALALARLPGHVPAAAHLAGLALAEGDAARAEALATKAAERSDDPELLALRGGALAKLGRGKEADDVIARARARTEALVLAEPAAHGLHAARFYAGVGKDPARALELAKAAWRLTSAPEAAALAIRVALDQGDVKTACAVRDAAQGLPEMVTLRAPRARAAAVCPAP